MLVSPGLFASKLARCAPLVTPWVSWEHWFLRVINWAPRSGGPQDLERESLGQEELGKWAPLAFLKLIQAVTSKVYMGSLGVVPAFSLADLRKKSKPMHAESWKHGQQVYPGTLVASARLHLLGHMAINFLVELPHLSPIESLKWSHLRR